MVEKKKFTRAEIALRNSRSDAAFIIDNVVYDVTHFLDEHPGGHEVLLNGAGNDVSEEFHDVDHSIDAKELRKKYAIGEVVDEDKVEAGARADGCENDVTVHVNAMYENMDATNERLERIKTETQKDNVLAAVINYYYEGWPNDKNQVITIARPYWTFRHELHEIKGILFHNNQVVIPSTLRKEMLNRIHEGHLGIEKCKRRARETVFWPGMGSQIEECVQRCDVCQRHRAAPPREPLAPHPMPPAPWHTLAADIFELDKRQYLLVVDYYSKFVEVGYLSNMRSDTVITMMKSIFSRFGIPSKLVTDNAKQFACTEFTEFAKIWDFKHVTSSPLYPRSNGLAERNVQTVKRLLKKASDDNTEYPLALLNFRNTPITGEKYSPAQLLMGRSLNTRLPVAPQALFPTAIAPERVRAVRRGRIDDMKRYHDRGTRPLSALSPGDGVRVKDGKVWRKAQVVKKADGDRSYWLKVDNGGTYRRNRSHIIKPNIRINVPERGMSDRYDCIMSNGDTESRDSPAPAASPPAPVAESARGPARPQLRLVIPREEARDFSESGTPSGTPSPRTTRSGRQVRPPVKFVCE